MEKEIGIIIPAYHAHDTIQRLLHSISIFSFIDKVAVCIVDDCDELNYDYLKNKFDNLDIIIFRNKENSGPGFSRNVGIQWARKNKIPFIMFADADDYFLNFDFWDKISDEEKTSNQYFIFNFFNDEMGCNVKDIDIWPFGKIYKTDVIINNYIEFPNSYSNEDVVFNFIYYSCIESMYVNNTTIYFWKNTPNSLSRTKDYLYHSYPSLITDLTDAFYSHKEIIPKEKIKPMVINRTIRLYYYLNELLFIYPNILKKTNDFDKSIFEALHYFYINCYKTVEEDICINDILQNFKEINNGDIITSFTWINFLDFLNIIKEDC